MEGSQPREVRVGKSLETRPQEHFVSPESPAVRAGKALKDYPFLPRREEGKLRPRRVGRVQGHTGGWCQAQLQPRLPRTSWGLRGACPGAAWMAFTFGDGNPGSAGQPQAVSSLGWSRAHIDVSDTAVWGQDPVAVATGSSEAKVRACCVASAVCQESELGLWLGSRLRSPRQ